MRISSFVNIVVVVGILFADPVLSCSKPKPEPPKNSEPQKTTTTTTTTTLPPPTYPIPLYIDLGDGKTWFLPFKEDGYYIRYLYYAAGRLDAGCFTFTKSTLFDKYANKDDWVLIPITEYARDQDNPEVFHCLDKCKGLAKYTYTGVVAGYEASCFCFNDINNLLTKSYCSGCIVVDLKVSNLRSIKGCKPTFPSPNITKLNTLYVLSTCPQGYYGPPNCNNRVKDTCAIVNVQGVAQAYANGTCALCNIKDSGKYNTMTQNCDVLQDNQPVEDYRLSTVVNKLPVNFLLWKDDFSTVVTDTNETAANNFIRTGPLIHAYNKKISFIDESRESRAVSIKGSSDLDPFFMPGKRYYLRHFWFKARAKGAFYFSLWNWIGGSAIQRYTTLYNKYQSEERVASFRIKFQLLAKYLIDVHYDDVHKWWDVNLPFTVANGQNPKFGYHSLDSKAQWGGTGTMKENSEFNSLVCTTVYASSFTLPEPSNNVYNYKNWNTLDTIPGWGNGKVVLTGRSDRAWWAVHLSDFEENNHVSDHVQNCGLRYTFAHYDDCLFKVMMAVACPDFCLRQQCNTDSSCKFGCVDGVAGTKCDVACPAGKFGQNCFTNCSAGCRSKVCARDTGLCTQGCVAGFYSANCSVPCKDGYFGQDCALQCSRNCVNPKSCNAVDGTCYGGCIVGYMPPMCQEPCDRGTFGPNCDYLCGYCKGRETCNAVNGTCRAGCAGLYMAPYCNCVAGTWGTNCAKVCGMCKDLLPCDVNSGYCLGYSLSVNGPVNLLKMCERGFQPPTCVCLSGTWGTDSTPTSYSAKNQSTCPNSCGKCFSGTCLDDTGRCLLGCVPGYRGYLCNDQCKTGTWGVDCAFTCGSCKGGQNTCDAVSGSCILGCDPGYQPPLCSDCAPGFWGPKCSKTCGHCRNKVACLRDTGACPFVGLPPEVSLMGSYIFKNVSTMEDVVAALIKATDSADTAVVVAVVKYLCETGYEPIMCTCKSGFYGDNCNQKCANCIAGCTENGTCLGGCVAGYFTPMCNISCNSGFFGPNCRFSCGHCFNNTICTAEDGICKQGCEPGYMLPKCICSMGYFGDDCKRVCGHCAVGTTCSFLDGSCQSGCTPGWKEPYCNCTIGSYMIDCSGKCGNCAGTNDCDFYSGVCQYGCNASYNEPLCVEKCQPGLFGPGCINTCGKCKDCEICQPDTGKCLSGCKKGFLEPDCLNTCPKGLYGDKCKNKCGNCISGTCDPVDGICDSGCIMGYLSPLCTQPCPSKTWGFNCLSSCGNCKNEKTCNYLDGTCAEGCDHNYMSPFCTAKINNAFTDKSACPEGLFLPPTCVTPCGKCKLSLPCNGVSGFCQSGCEPGYEPVVCVYPCADGLWGANCLQTCGNCAGTGSAAVCRKTDGMCTSGCVDGWFGDTCKYKDKDLATAAAKNNGCKVELSPLTRIVWILLLSAHALACV